MNTSLSIHDGGLQSLTRSLRASHRPVLGSYAFPSVFVRHVRGFIPASFTLCGFVWYAHRIAVLTLAPGTLQTVECCAQVRAVLPRRSSESLRRPLLSHRLPHDRPVVSPAVRYRGMIWPPATRHAALWSLHSRPVRPVCLVKLPRGAPLRPICCCCGGMSSFFPKCFLLFSRRECRTRENTRKERRQGYT